MNTLSILIVVFFIFLILKYWTQIFGAGYDPTPQKIAMKMLEMADLKKKEILYDLGCGDGRFLILGAKKFGARGIGIDISPLRYTWAKINVKLNNLSDKIKIKHGNFFKFSISDADVVALFLFEPTNRKLSEKFKKELKPSARIVSYYWKIPGLKPSEIDKKYHIYLYKMKDQFN